MGRATVLDVVGGNVLMCKIDLGFNTTVRRKIKLHGTRLSKGRIEMARDYLDHLKGEEIMVRETGPVDSGMHCARISFGDVKDVSTDMITRGFLLPFRPHRRE